MKYFRFTVEWLQSRGYKPIYSKGIFEKNGYLAGTDQRRLREYQGAWRGMSKAIFCTRGGYGSMRLFNFKQKPVTKAKSKIMMGMSDITVLLNDIAQRHRIVTIHGPVLSGDLFSGLKEFERDKIFSLLEHPEPQNLVLDHDYELVFPGIARGRVWGGNLSLVAASMGTKFEIKPRGPAVLFLEDVCEPSYRLDRMFAQLCLSGFIQRFKAVLLGDFTDLDGKTIEKSILAGLLRDLLPKKIPVVFGIGCSHVRMRVLMPIGGEVDLKRRNLVISPLVE